ncbi:MAG: hypothetical protein A2655_01840 [Candidatus Yanofskybacteria bacterium RIFCSPHIGHO2_01_FULL_43_42]|uniref:Uncharacterized protein n=1 Tax=Candidatus Yanofskybacteria bacterium RIFCSPLOWO2_01_FULL_43_22 TaxID=1802695 RepID=A0A1F8GGW3_9BACT|nr:MAG: hypothetical protein A2655_01840 [Candidatus Yanofskybacteria bacterium RIFCSPHIGHO2_01_FULL_43_42]OGN13216.1 MAG: hypothetical protein A3D48_02745 [Candidatus Yanofskybacteria bacterium RIFCSPHIGHO2_02_FULL_43_17]OGN24632.1 MAG: hypothetical protein A3A13_00970 [Candidatus Yanofskybacteria bacterium RIFCSPLOWO2_01_FULL_43_22]
MDPRKLKGLNTEKNNTLESPFPYWWAFGEQNQPQRENLSQKAVLFLGNDMATFTKAGTDADAYVKKCNQCLDYIRMEFKDFELYYKPHPADKIERVSLNLDGFEILEDGMSAELYLFKNYDRIRSVFSVGSAASYNAYAMGMDAHVFYKCFSNIFDGEKIRPLDEFYYSMPLSFFITDLAEKPVNNSRLLEKDGVTETFFKSILASNTSDNVWLVVFTVEYAVLLIALSNLIRSIVPSKKVRLIISSHSYWKTLGSDDFKNNFDEIIMWPRIYCSLRPLKLWQAVLTAIKVKKFDISKNDLFISITQNSFVENCLNSYNKNSQRIGLISDKDFNLFYNSGNSVYTENSDFRFSKASWFFNKILEPLLGLNRSLFMSYGKDKDSFINRYQKPVNEIFDKVIVMKADTI